MDVHAVFKLILSLFMSPDYTINNLQQQNYVIFIIYTEKEKKEQIHE